MGKTAKVEIGGDFSFIIEQNGHGWPRVSLRGPRVREPPAGENWHAHPNSLKRLRERVAICLTHSGIHPVDEVDIAQATQAVAEAIEHMILTLCVGDFYSVRRFGWAENGDLVTVYDCSIRLDRVTRKTLAELTAELTAGVLDGLDNAPKMSASTNQLFHTELLDYLLTAKE